MISNILLKYENKWVALTPDRTKVLAHAKTIKQLNQKVKTIPIKDLIFSYVLPFNGSLAP